MPIYRECKTFQKLRILSRDDRAVIVHHVNEQGVWATHNRKILFKHHTDKTWKNIGTFEIAMPRDLFGWSRPARRAMRVDKCNLFPTKAGKLLGIRSGKVYSIGEGVLEPLLRIQGDCVLHRGISETQEGEIYFGEYFMNPARHPVHIWRVASDMQTSGIAYTFPGGRIRHVHGIYRDPYRNNRLWVTVGDYQGECYLLYTDDHFKTLHRLGDGSQIWRAVGILFTPESILWLTDSHFEQNYIMSMDRETHQLSYHGEIENSVWYSLQTTDGIFLAATTVEIGSAIHSDYASLMASRNGIDWEVVASFKKDSLPLKYFKFGVISFPAGHFTSQSFWISGEALDGVDGCSLLCQLISAEEGQI